MKTFYGTVLILLAMLAVACAQKVNDPADVQAIKDIVTRFDKAISSGGVEALVADYDAAGAMRMHPNQPALVGSEAIRAAFQGAFSQSTTEVRNGVEDVRVSGDLAVARGTYESKSTAKSGGEAVRDKGKWAAAFRRQADGSWKALWDIYNSDLPVADILPLGPEELALLQLERELSEAALRRDVAGLDRIFATEWAANTDGLVVKKAQILAELKSGVYKIESLTLSEMKAIVLGETAVAVGLSTAKSTYRGKDSSGQFRWTDVFKKRDGRWQCVSSYNNKVS